MLNLQYRLPAILIVISFLLPIPAAQAEPIVTAPRIIEAATNTLSPLNESIIADELTERYHPNDEQLAKREYVPKNPEVIAKTKEQVQSFDCATVTDVPQIECEALVAFYNSTNGAGWTNSSGWLVLPTVGSWFGVWTFGGNVRGLGLSRNNLSGSIPPDLVNLAKLQELSLDYNQFSGSIPPELGSITSLWSLRLNNNHFSGSIPPELGSLSNLDSLSLSYNQLSGSIPPELGSLTNLNTLGLSDNQLTGSIPTELGSLTNLQYLDLAYNQLSGPIPTELGSLTNLYYLYLDNNQLSGSIPLELGSLSNLRSLYLNDNLLSGSIPPELGSLSNLHYLILGSNQLSGFIPSELSHLSNLLWLYLPCNQLSGSIPPELSGMTSLLYLTLSDNQLSGSIPSTLGNLTNLQSLDLCSNQLSGSIPSNLGHLTDLQDLCLYSNQLSGSIPSTLGNLPNLQGLYLSNNQLSGAIPLSFVNLTNLERFYFEGTQLCEPTTPEFLAWKETVTYWQGNFYVCEVPEAPSWLLMYYVAADNNLNDVLLSEVGSIIDNRQPNVDIAIFVDSASQDSAYRFFKHDGSVENFNMGNLNSGSGSTLADFILWAKSKSTAPQDALIISDHGHGLTGVAWDYRANRDNISVQEELRSALLTSGSVDVIYSHTCLTANMEFIWELRGLADFYVASESISFSTDHDYIATIGLYTTASDLAVSMAKSYYSFRYRGYTPSTVSVINMAYLDEMFVATNALALAIQESPLAVKIDIWNLLDYTVLQRFHERGSIEINNVDRLADLFHFAALVNYFPEVSPAAQTLLNLQNDFVVYNRAWSGVWEQAIWLYNNAKGVSIALPLDPASFYDGEWLEFAAGADWSFVNPGAQSSVKVDGYNWGPMVSDLIAQNNPQGEDDPLPPEPLPLLISYGIYLPILVR